MQRTKTIDFFPWQVIYVTTNRQGQRIYRNEVNLIGQLAQGSPTGNVNVVVIENPFPGGGVVVQDPRTTRRPIVYPPTVQTPRPTLPPTPRTTSITVIQRGVVIPLQTFDMRSGSSVSFNFKTINQVRICQF